MAEKIISPGVFTSEIDESFLPAAIGDIGAAIIGPTLKGPVMVPTVVSSYAEYTQLFGNSFRSGSSVYRYLSDHTAEEYFKSGNKATIIRTISGSAVKAKAYIGTAGFTSGSTKGLHATYYSPQKFADISASIHQPDAAGEEGDAVFANDWRRSTNHNIRYELTASLDFNNKGVNGGRWNEGASGGSNCSFVLHALGDGADVNSLSTQLQHVVSKSTGGEDVYGTNAPYESTNGLLLSASKDSLRWEIPSVNYDNGTFNLLIRRGDDLRTRKNILETWNNLSLDPNTTNFIGNQIGDQYISLQGAGTTDPYLQYVGDYPNKSKYVRVEVVQGNLTPDYLDSNGNIRNLSFSGSLPLAGLSGSFMSGSVSEDSVGSKTWGLKAGAYATGAYYYENIDSGNSQGFNLDNTTYSGDGAGPDENTAHQQYIDALALLSNQDEYDVNLIFTPGVISSLAGHSAIAKKAIDVCENRGDAFYVMDSVVHGSNLSDVTTQAKTRNSSFAATYWPWVKINDSVSGIPRWVPPSVTAAGVYTFSDKVAQPWFAPAGLNRGNIQSAIEAERKLSNNERDDLYNSNVNPIATFAGQGVVLYGQKTLQKKSSALDRVNVRRLLIKVKKFVASTSRFLVFEQNNVATRNRFLNIVNPYLEQIQSNSGLNAFKVVMDDTNNTPDVVDRNILMGQLFLQPTRTAEFIVLDFTVQPTGASFPE